MCYCYKKLLETSNTVSKVIDKVKPVIFLNQHYKCANLAYNKLEDLEICF